MDPLTWGESSGFQARREFSPEDQKSQQGSHGGTREFAPTPVFLGGFVPHKVCDLLRVQGGPIDMAGRKTGRQQTPAIRR